jgi:hypothetical protein
VLLRVSRTELDCCARSNPAARSSRAAFGRDAPCLRTSTTNVELEMRTGKRLDGGAGVSACESSVVDVMVLEVSCMTPASSTTTRPFVADRIACALDMLEIGIMSLRTVRSGAVIPPSHACVPMTTYVALLRGVTVDIFVRSERQWSSIVKSNPFDAEAVSDPRRVVMMASKEKHAAAAVAALAGAIVGSERIHTHERRLYICYRDGIGATDEHDHREEAQGARHRTQLEHGPQDRGAAQHVAKARLIRQRPSRGSLLNPRPSATPAGRSFRIARPHYTPGACVPVRRPSSAQREEKSSSHATLGRPERRPQSRPYAPHPQNHLAPNPR